jgi:PAS domain S-box-containing protein
MIPGKKLLVVEDERALAKIVRHELLRAGFEVCGTAETGQDAVAMAASLSPDLVLMDIGLQGEMDGVAAARQIRLERGIPSIFLTGMSDSRTFERAKEAEPLGFIVKPIVPGELRATIETALHHLEVSRRREAEAVRKVEYRYQSIFENAQEGIYQTEPSGRILMANNAFARMLGYGSAQDLMQQDADMRQHYVEPSARTDFEARLSEQGVVKGFEVQLKKRDGTTVWAANSARDVRSENGTVLYYQGILTDITARKLAESERNAMEVQLRHAQKLEAVGQLAAGIAHEINTPTQYIGDNTRFLLDGFAELARVLETFRGMLSEGRDGGLTAEQLAKACEVVEAADTEYLLREIPKAISQSLEGIERVSAIVRAMKEFSHPAGDEKQAVDLNHCIASTITVSRNEWKYVANMTTELDPRLPAVPCLPGEINQVILNLIVNAAHAIGDVVDRNGSTKGNITVRTRREGAWAVVEVADTGKGIPAAIQSRIFEPFFTTKEVGKGTGQGLAISRAVVVGKHGGDIGFTSEEGVGTTFSLRLPLDIVDDM